MRKMNNVVIAILLFVTTFYTPAHSKPKNAKKDAGQILITTLIVKSSHVNDELLNGSFFFVPRGTPITYVTLNSDQLKAIFKSLGIEGESSSLADVHIAGNNEETTIISNMRVAAQSGEKATFNVGELISPLFFSGDVCAGYQVTKNLAMEMIPRILEDNIFQLNLEFYMGEDNYTGSATQYGAYKSGAEHLNMALRPDDTLMINLPAQYMETPHSKTQAEDKSNTIIFITADYYTDNDKKK